MTARWRARIDAAADERQITSDHYRDAIDNRSTVLPADIYRLWCDYERACDADAAVRAAYDRHLSQVRHHATTRARARRRHA